MKPHQLSGGGNCTNSLFKSSRGIPFKPGASVGRGDTPATAMRPMGVGIGPSHGIAIAIRTSRDAYRNVLREGIVAGAQVQQDDCW